MNRENMLSARRQTLKSHILYGCEMSRTETGLRVVVRGWEVGGMEGFSWCQVSFWDEETVF